MKQFTGSAQRFQTPSREVIPVLTRFGFQYISTHTSTWAIAQIMGDTPPYSPLSFCENDKNIRGGLEPLPILFKSSI